MGSRLREDSRGMQFASELHDCSYIVEHRSLASPIQNVVGRLAQLGSLKQCMPIGAPILPYLLYGSLMRMHVPCHWMGREQYRRAVRARRRDLTIACMPFCVGKASQPKGGRRAKRCGHSVLRHRRHAHEKEEHLEGEAHDHRFPQLCCAATI